MAICGRKIGYTSDLEFFSGKVEMGIEARLAKPTSTQQTVCKNIQKHAI